MKTRVARQMDVLRLRRLDSDGVSVLHPSPLDDGRGVATALFVPGREKSWLTEDASGVIGFAQARPRRYVLGWELDRLSVRRDRDPEDVVGMLVQEILQYLQDRGIPRLFARTQEDSRSQQLLLGCGFSQLLAETVYVRNPQVTPPPAETPVGMRYRMPQDAWPLRQLENGQTPQLISQLEGLTSASWSMPKQRPFGNEEQADLIIERDGDIVGWAGWTFVGPGHGMREHARMALLIETDHSELASPLLDYALYTIYSKRPAAQVIVRLRDYQAPLQTALLEREFVEAARESVLIKHGRLQTVTKNARKLFELVPAKQTALSLESTITTR